MVDLPPERLNLTCVACGGPVTAKSRKGPIPRYCSDSCRQKAYQRRHGFRPVNSRCPDTPARLHAIQLTGCTSTQTDQFPTTRMYVTAGNVTWHFNITNLTMVQGLIDPDDNNPRTWPIWESAGPCYTDNVVIYTETRLDHMANIWLPLHPDNNEPDGLRYIIGADRTDGIRLTTGPMTEPPETNKHGTFFTIPRQPTGHYLYQLSLIPPGAPLWEPTIQPAPAPSPAPTTPTEPNPTSPAAKSSSTTTTSPDESKPSPPPNTPADTRRSPGNFPAPESPAQPPTPSAGDGAPYRLITGWHKTAPKTCKQS